VRNSLGELRWEEATYLEAELLARVFRTNSINTFSRKTVRVDGQETVRNSFGRALLGGSEHAWKNWKPLKRGNGSVVLEGSENAAWTGWKPLKIA